MGWLYMTSLNGHSGPRQYLDAQFTHAGAAQTLEEYRAASAACGSGESAR